MTYDGQVVKFPFFLDESDGVDYLIKCVEDKALGVYGDNIDDNIPRDTEVYRIDGKHYGITYIIISLIIFALFSLIEMPMLLREVSANHWLSAFFFAIGLLLPLSVVIRLLLRYFFYRVKIENNRFYLQTNPFNGKYYEYKAIKNCKEVLIVSRLSRSYFYYFIFTDVTNKTRKFLFQKNIHGHEIDVLKKRISHCTHRQVTEEVSYGGSIVIKNAIRIIAFALIVVMLVFFGCQFVLKL